MAVGTDSQIFQTARLSANHDKGRPKVNRDLAAQLITAGYSTRRIMQVLKCKSRTVRLIRQEMKAAGVQSPHLDEAYLDKVAVDFEDEASRAMGFSFSEWLKSKRSNWRKVFNFCQKVWTQAWDKPSLVLVKDRNQSLADELALKFMATFGEDKERIRDRKKLIRYLFAFLGREDINNRHLTMTISRDPIPIREVPELSMPNFPTRLNEAFIKIEDAMGEEVATALKLKVCSQMRTGEGMRELMGLQCGANGHSYLIMTSHEDWRMKITGKGNESWTITWLPLEVRLRLWRIYLARKHGDKLFRFNINKVRLAWRSITEQIVGIPMSLHDLRKVSLTWLWALGIPLEIATTFNVGWRDLNTARDHYLQYRRLLRGEDRRRYAEQIPDWFKEGLQEYVGA